MLIGAADPTALLREQRVAEAEAARLEQAAKDATGAAAKAKALAGELDARITASRSAVAASRARLEGIDAQRRILEARLNEARQPIAKLVAAMVALQRRPAALAGSPAMRDSSCVKAARYARHRAAASPSGISITCVSRATRLGTGVHGWRSEQKEQHRCLGLYSEYCRGHGPACSTICCATHITAAALRNRADSAVVGPCCRCQLTVHSSTAVPITG